MLPPPRPVERANGVTAASKACEEGKDASRTKDSQALWNFLCVCVCVVWAYAAQGTLCLMRQRHRHGSIGAVHKRMVVEAW